MSNVFVTSDWHDGHEKVALERGYADVAEQRAAIMDAISTQTKPKDTVWNLGDLTMGGAAAEQSLMSAMVQNFPDRKFHLVFGNHDSGHPMHRGAQSHQRRFLLAFESVQTVARIRFDGERFMASHFPYAGDHTTEDRFPEFRLQDKGIPILHGHTHSPDMFSVKFRGINATPTFQLHAGWDAHRALVPMEDMVRGLRQLRETYGTERLAT